MAAWESFVNTVSAYAHGNGTKTILMFGGASANAANINILNFSFSLFPLFSFSLSSFFLFVLYEGVSPETAVFRSAGYIAYDAIMLVAYVLMLLFSAYSLGVTVMKTGTRITARSSVFFLATVTSIFKIISFASNIALVNKVFYFAEYISYLFAYYCFVSLLFAWLKICVDVLGAQKQYWMFLRYGLWLFVVLAAVPGLLNAIAVGPLLGNLYDYRTITTERSA